jgi:hypothetical protein
MKFLFVSLAAIFFCQTAKAQKLDSATIARLSPEKQQEVKLYLRQASNARTTALILCMTGGSLVLLGSVLSVTEDINNDYYNSGEFDLNTGGQVAVVGVMVGLTSIPFFIKIHNKRNQARAVIYGDKGAMLSPSARFPGTGGVGVGLVLGLGR